MIAIVDHRPQLLSLTSCLDAFIAHRKDVVLRRTKYLLNKKQENIVNGINKGKDR